MYSTVVWMRYMVIIVMIIMTVVIDGISCEIRDEDDNDVR